MKSALEKQKLPDFLKYFLVVIFVVVLALIAGAISHFSAVARTEPLQLGGISINEGWNLEETIPISEPDNIYATTTSSNSTFTTTLDETTTCDDEILSIAVEGVVFGTENGQLLNLSILDEANLTIDEISTDQNNPSQFRFELLTKDSGVSWNCDDLASLYVRITADQAGEDELSEPIWNLDFLSMDVTYQIRLPELRQANYKWNTLAEDNNITPLNSENLTLKKGQKSILYLELLNSGNIASPTQQYKLQYAPQIENSCNEGNLRWTEVSDTTEITPWFPDEPDAELTNWMANDGSCSQGLCEKPETGTHFDYDAFYSLSENSSLQLSFPIDTVNSKNGENYCFRVVRSELGEGQFVVLDDYQNFPSIKIEEEKETKFNKPLQTVKLKRIKDPEDAFGGGEESIFELSFFEALENGELYFEEILESERVLQLDKYTFTAVMVDPEGKEYDEPVTIRILPNGQIRFHTPPTHQYKPGKYKLVVSIDDGSGFPQTIEQDFVWGVLAVNTDNDVYRVNDPVDLMMTVLDDEGNTVCEADVTTTITSPSGSTSSFSTNAETINKSTECGPNNVTYTPDYFTTYSGTSETGEYEISMSATTENGTRTIIQTFEVEDAPDFIVSRESAVRIYPISDYLMRITITSDEGYTGEVVEKVPLSFKLKDTDALISKNNEEQMLTWDVDLQPGESIELVYTYDAPDISPEFYTLGPVQIDMYQEKRLWQVASDAVTSKYAVTCTTWTNTAGAQGAPDLADTAGFTSFTTTNSAYNTVSAQNDMDCSGFNATSLGTFNSAEVMISLAADGTTGDNDTTDIQYDVNGGGYNTLSTITHNSQKSNSTNGGYWTYTAGNITSWADVGNTTVRFINSKVGGPDRNDIYVDAVWIEVDYTPNTITMSGTCKEYNNSTDCDTAHTVAFAINGTSQGQTTTVSAGTWTITGVSQPQSGDIVTAYLSGVANDDEANTVMKYDGSGNITGVPLIKEHLVIGSDDNQTISNSEISNFDNASSGVEDIFFEVDGSNNLNVDGTTNSTQEVLYVDAGNVYQPASAGSVTTTTHDFENNGTFTLNANTIKLEGSWLNNSTFNSNTGTTTFIATSGTETIDNAGGTGGFNNLTLGESSGTATWNLSSALDINGAMNITYGTLDMNGGNAITLGGNLTLGSSGGYTKGTSTFTFDGTATQTWTDNTTGQTDMGDVRYGATSHTVQLGSSAKATSMIIPTGITFDLTSNGYTYTSLGSGAGVSRPFYINGGTFTSGTNSTFIYSSGSALDVQSTTYDELKLESTASTTFTIGTAAAQTLNADNITIGDGTNTLTVTAETYDPTVDIANNFSILASGTYSASSTGNFNIGGNWSNSGTFTDNTGTVTFDATTTGKTLSGTLTGTSEFYEVTFNGSGGGWTINDPMTVSADTSSALSVDVGTVTVGDGNGDDLTIMGQLNVGSSTAASTLQTASGLTEGNEIEININTPTPATCTNCNVIVGTATDGDPAGTLIINKNGVLRLNSETSVETGVEVRASGDFQVIGSNDMTGTATSGTNDTTLNDSGEAWAANEHQNKHLVMTSGYAEGKVTKIDSNISSTLSFTDEFPTSDTGGSYAAATHTFTSSVSLISANDDGIGQYLYNSTQGIYSKITDSTENTTTDTFKIADYPQTFAYTSGDNVSIATGIQSGDTYYIVDYAYVTGGGGSACDADEVTQFHGYIYGLQNSETTLTYANTCDLGDNISNKYGMTFVNVAEADANETASITNSYLHHNYDSVYLSGTSGVQLSSNTIEESVNGVTLSGATSNRITNNLISESSSTGVNILNSGSKNNRIDNNIFFGSGTNISVSGSSINRIEANDIAGGTYGIHLLSSANSNFIYQNLVYGSTSRGIYVQTTNDHRLWDNEVFGGASGLYLTGSTGTISFSDEYGLQQGNTYDIEYDSTAVSGMGCYGCDMGSTTEYTGITATGSYLISEDHDPSSQSGLTRIIGEYTVPNDITETVSYDEGTQQFNYADPLWDDAASPAAYVGTGTEDTDIQITLTSALSSIEMYIAEVTTANADTPTFTITRTGGTATPATYTLPGTYTETGTGVQFTIQDGAVNYALGDVYAFIVGPDSADTNIQKIVQVMQSGDDFITGSGETLELVGLSTSNTEVQGPTGGFQFDIGGTINASDYKISKTDAVGLNITSTATVTNLDDGIFDDSEGGGSTDTYITVDPAVLNNGAATHTNVTFDATPSDSNAEYNVTLSTNPSACTNTWTFENSPGLKATESFDNDSGDGGPCNSGAGYILFASSTNNPPNDPTALAQKTTTDTVIVQADWIDSTSVKFTASASDPDLSDTLELCIEIDTLATAFSGTQDSCGTGVAYSGTAVNVDHTITGLTDGAEYHWQARIRDANSNLSNWVSYGTNTETERDIGIDTTAPTSGTAYDGETYLTDADENDGNLSHLYGSWTGFADAQSGIRDYEYAIGTTQGATDVVNWTSNANAGALFGDGFETGDLLEWDANSTGGGDLAASIVNPNTGLYSMATTINDTGAIFVQDDFSSATEYYGRFYFNMNSNGPGNNQSITLFSLSDGSTSRADVLVGRTGGTYWVRTTENTGATSTADVTISLTAWVSIEIHWKAGTSEPVTMWVDGTAYQTSNANTSALTVNKAQLGYLGGVNLGGTIYQDDYSSDTQYRQGPVGYLSTDVVSANHLRTGQNYYLSVRAVNNADTASTAANTDGQSVLPTFSFSLNKSSISFLNLNYGNSWSDTQSIQTTASTNAYNGYITRVYITQPMTNTFDGSYTIANYSGTNSAPTVWSGSGFGYSTDDNNLSGGTADRFTSGGPKYAGFSTTGPGDPVADHISNVSGTTGAILNESFNVTLKVTTSESQAAGPYTTDIVFVATPNF